MKKTAVLIAAALTALFVSCKKEDPDKIQFALDGNLNFERVELVESVNANVTVSAPRKIESLSLAFSLGDINSIVNQHIGIAVNKGWSSKSPVFDLIEDKTVISYLESLGVPVGAMIRGEESFTFNLSTIMLALVEGQPIQNNATFSVEIRVTDQGGFSASRSVKFHFTSAPEISWAKNPDFGTVVIDPSISAVNNYYVVSIWAPGKVKELTIALDEAASDPVLKQWVVNMVSGNKAVIDLVNDPVAINAFKMYFQTSVSGQERVSLDFSFMDVNVYQLTNGSTSKFTINVTDTYGKKSEAALTFRISRTNM